MKKKNKKKDVKIVFVPIPIIDPQLERYIREERIKNAVERGDIITALKIALGLEV